MMISSFRFSLKYLIIWVTILASSIVGAMALGMNGEGVGTDGPLTGNQAFFIVNAIHALVLSIIAARSSIRGWKLAFLIWATLFFGQSFFLLMEAWYFIESLNLSLNFLIQGALHVFIVAVFTSVVAAAMWKTPSKSNIEAPVSNISFRLGIIAVLYVISYFLAGKFIAWANPSVQEYYSFGANISLIPLLSFQLLRGALWGLLAFFLSKSLYGSLRIRAFIIGLAFSILATAQLLYPSTFMPWSVRLPHMIEVGISNFCFGFLAGIVLQIKSLNLRAINRPKRPS